MAVVTKSDYENALKTYNKDYTAQNTWNNLYGSVWQSGQIAKQQTQQSYSDAMAEAYQSYLTSQQSVGASNYGQGYKSMLRSELDTALSDAYAQYMSNQASAMSSINEQVSEGYSAIDELLETEAQYNLDFDNAVKDYYTWLASWYSENKTEDGDNIFLDNVRWKEKYLTAVDDTSTLGDELTFTDKEGNTYALKSIDDLSAGFYDDTGNMTESAKDFYSEMMNVVGVEEGWSAPSFSDYLQQQDTENKTDLYSWATSYNPYNYAIDRASRNTKISSFRELIGLKSDEESYNFIEHSAGYTDEQFNNLMAPINNFVENINSKDFDVTTEKGRTNLNDIATELLQYSKDLGLISQDELTQAENVFNNAIQSTNNLTDQDFWDRLAQVATGTAIGTTAGISLGAIIGGVAGTASAGPVGTVIGGAVGGIVGVIIGSIAGLIGGTITAVAGEVTERNRNRNIGEQIKSQYTDILAKLALEAEKQRKTQINK